MELTIQQLRQICTAVLDRMEQVSDNGRVVVPDNYYWSVPNDRLFVADVPIVASDLTVGQVSEDISSALDTLENKDEVIRFHAEKLGHVLRFASLSLNDGVW